MGLQHAAQVEVKVGEAPGSVHLLQLSEELRLLPEQLRVDLAPVVHAGQVKVGPTRDKMRMCNCLLMSSLL